jgi:acetylornithine aminotransferase
MKMSQYFESEFKSKIMSYSVVKELRIKGLMIGIGLDENIIDCSKLTQKALEDKLLINITGNSIRMLPPLIISKKEIDILINKIIKLITI